MAATKAQLMTDIRDALEADGRASDHFQLGACDLDAVCAGLIEFLANEIAAGGVTLADGDYGDITISSSGTAFTVDNKAITLAKMNDIATATFIGRTTAGTGVPEALTVTQATALLNAANATTKGLVPTPPNNTTTFLRGDATFAAPPTRNYILWYGCDTVTAGSTGNYLNPVGIATTPAGTAIAQYRVPFSGTIVKVVYLVNTAHTTNTVVIKTRINGSLATVQTVAATVATQEDSASTAVTAGDSIGCSIDHNGATNVRRITVGYVIEY